LWGGCLRGAEPCEPCLTQARVPPHVQPCPAGNYCPAGAAAPIQCKAGYVAGPKAVSCTACGSGTYQVKAACTCIEQLCFAPLPPTWRPGPPASRLILSTPASLSPLLQPKPGQSSCLSCAAGAYCPGAAQIATTLCPAGTARATTGGSSIKDCGACPANSFSAATGSSKCSTCPAGQWTNKRTSQVKCWPTGQALPTARK